MIELTRWVMVGQFIDIHEHVLVALGIGVLVLSSAWALKRVMAMKTRTETIRWDYGGPRPALRESPHAAATLRATSNRASGIGVLSFQVKATGRSPSWLT